MSNLGDRVNVKTATIIWAEDTQYFRSNWDSDKVDDLGSNAQVLIQNAVNDGGTVCVKKGNYGIVNIKLKDRCFLIIEMGASLIGYSVDVKDKVKRCEVLDFERGTWKTVSYGDLVDKF